MNDSKINNNISKVSYLGIDEVITRLEEIGNDNVTIGKKFEDTINSFKNDKSLSSKVITPSMENMIASINNLNIKFKENNDKYCEFLRNEVKQGYMTGDSDIKNIWDSLKDIFNKAKE